MRALIFVLALSTIATPALAQETVPSEAPAANYRLSGDKALRPSRITDDGTHMYLEWSAEQDLPAVFSVTTLGEGMVEGYMRGGIFIIDRVYAELVFRIDKKWAKAQRVSR